MAHLDDDEVEENAESRPFLFITPEYLDRRVRSAVWGGYTLHAETMQGVVSKSAGKTLRGCCVTAVIANVFEEEADLTVSSGEDGNPCCCGHRTRHTTSLTSPQLVIEVKTGPEV